MKFALPSFWSTRETSSSAFLRYFASQAFFDAMLSATVSQITLDGVCRLKPNWHEYWFS
jgi:hypothetical protein